MFLHKELLWPNNMIKLSYECIGLLSTDNAASFIASEKVG